MERSGVFPAREIILKAVLSVVGKKSILCFQRLSVTHYDVTFKDGCKEALETLLVSGISIEGLNINIYESAPKSIAVTIKNLPAEVPDPLLSALLSSYGEVIGVTKARDADGIWTGDRTVEMLVAKDIPLVSVLADTQSMYVIEVSECLATTATDRATLYLSATTSAIVYVSVVEVMNIW